MSIASDLAEMRRDQENARIIQEAAALLDIPAATLRGLRDGSLVAVLAEMDDCLPLREAIDEAYCDGEGTLTGASLYALWRKMVKEYAAQKDPPND